MPVHELQARMTSREFAEWVAYWQLEPFGPPVEDLRSGVIAATMANIHRDVKKRRDPYSPGDFLPWLEGGLQERPSAPPPDAEALWKRFRTWAVLSGAKGKA